MLAFHTDQFRLPLPPGHRFPQEKYRRLRERVLAEVPGIELEVAPAATDGELALAHTPDYVTDVAEGRLDDARQREIGFPWSPEMVERSRRSVGATIAAARVALSKAWRPTSRAARTTRARRRAGAFASSTTSRWPRA